MSRAALALLLLASCTGSPASNEANASANSEADGVRVIALPESLAEISGLAVASPTSLFAHDDEQAMVREISVENGRILRSFRFGGRGDFEGIAAPDGRIFVITSEGMLSSFAAAADGATVTPETVDTGAGEQCEIEGLSLAPQPGRLLILCKEIRGRGNRGRLLILAWDIAARRLAPFIDADLEEALGENRRGFAPSSIDWDAGRRRIVIVSARNRLLLELDERGRVTNQRVLEALRHPQAEGVAVMPNGALAIADERGDSGGSGRLTVYPTAR
ncbi:SdiA-regulated domain-containing protein [Sphingosinicella sp.]|uniref:SdiA-regulated domain-containing protein n=1 Tax=Sphingosinicella sp. TaxID=1917971 RepID=UPI0040383FF9